MTVARAAERGDERELLVALRDRIAAVIDADTSARDLAALTRRLLDVANQLAELDEREAIIAEQAEEEEEAAAAAAERCWLPDEL